MKVTFCGHSQIVQPDKVTLWLTSIISALIKNGADTFYLGGYGHFDQLSATVINGWKTTYPHIKSALVLPYLNFSGDLSPYDFTIYPPLESVPPRFAIPKRNEWMVQQSDVIVAYVLHDWGGAAATLRYAQRKQKIIVAYPDTENGDFSTSSQ